MGRFLLFLLLLFLVSLGLCVIAQLDFMPEEISISGNVFLGDNAAPDGIKIRVVSSKTQALTKEWRDYCLTDTSGEYHLKNITASKGLTGKAFLLWLNGNKEWMPHLKLRVNKEGYLPTEIIITKYDSEIIIPSITLDSARGRHRLNQLIYQNERIKILKDVTEYYFCPLHDYFWFYPRCYDLEVAIPTEEGKEVVKAEVRLIIQPLYTTFVEEIERLRYRLRDTIQHLAPEVSKTQIKIHGGSEVADALSNQSLINKLNSFLYDSKIKQIQLISANLKRPGRLKQNGLSSD